MTVFSKVFKCLTYFLINSNQQDMSKVQSATGTIIAQILERNGKEIPQTIKQLFILLSNTDPSERHLIQTAILFSMESIHEWNNLLIYAQKWKAQSFMKQSIRRMKNRLNEQANNNYGLSLIDELKRLIQKYWMIRSPKKVQNVYQEHQSYLPRNTINANNTNNMHQNHQKQSKSLVPIQIQNEIKNPTITGFFDQPALLNKEVAPQLKGKNDPLTNVTGRPTILKKQSILMQNLKQKDAKQDVVYKTEKNENKTIYNAPTNPNNDNVIKLLLDYNKNKQQQLQHRLIQKNQSTSRLLLIQPPKIPTKNVDQECPPQRFNFGSSKKSETYKSITVSPIKYDPEQCIIKIKRREVIPAPKPQPVSQIKSTHEFSFTKQKLQSPKQIESIPDNHFDSFYNFEKPQQIQPVEPAMIQKPPQVVEIVESAPLSFISYETTPTFEIKRVSAKRYAQSLTDDDLKMVGSDTKPRYLWNNICENLGLKPMKYFDQIMKLDF